MKDKTICVLRVKGIFYKASRCQVYFKIQILEMTTVWMKLENLICRRTEVDLLLERFQIVDKVLCLKISILNQAHLKLELKILNYAKILLHFKDQEIIKMIIILDLGLGKGADGIIIWLMKVNRIIRSELELNLYRETLSQILLCVIVVHHNKNKEFQDLILSQGTHSRL